MPPWRVCGVGRCAAVVILSVLISACGSDPAPSQERLLPARGALVGQPRQVVLITIDTLRTTHLGSYGYDRDTSPFIDRLAREGVLMTRAYSPVPRTTPAHMSMLTGLPPLAHGAMRNTHAIGADHVPSLAAFFRSVGYATAAVVSVPFLNPEVKRLPGFEHIEAPAMGVQWRSRSTLRRAEAWVRAHADQPFFLWIHTYDLHKPYAPPRPYDTMFWDSAPLPYEPPKNGLLTGPPPTAREADYLRALYDGEIRYTDDALRGFFERLDGTWIAPPLVVVTSDHGEVLEEHARDFRHVYFHGKFPFNQALRVPLIVHWPGHVSPGRRAAAVDITSLAPTLVDMLFDGGFEAGTPSFAGLVTDGVTSDGGPHAPSGDAPLFALAPRLYPDEVMLPGWEFRRQETWSVLRWPWHLIYNPDRGSVLYDLSTDELELSDLAAVHPQRAAELEREVIEHFRAQTRVAEGVVPVSEELHEQLRGLGYVE
jgi:arylsulfatase A-like enzyme